MKVVHGDSFSYLIQSSNYNDVSVNISSIKELRASTVHLL